MPEVLTPRNYVARPFEPMSTTLRDGLQSPLWNDYKRFYPTPEEMVKIFRAEIQLGVRFFEFFSPIVSERAAEDMNTIIRARDETRLVHPHPIFVMAHARVDYKDVETALAAGVDGLNLYFGTSDVSLESKHSKPISIEDVAKKTRELIEDIRKRYPDIWIRFSGEDAFRTDPEKLFTVYDTLQELVDAVGTPDTVGGANPDQVARRVALLKRRYPNLHLEGHFHNDRSFALINALVALKEGMGFIDTSVLGVAERSGISSLTGLLLNVDIERPDLLDGFDLIHSYALNVLLADIMQMQVPSTELVNATHRTHYAGVHASAVLKDPRTYEEHDLARFGVDRSTLLLGPLSGRNSVHYYLTQFLNYGEMSAEVLTQITSEFKTITTNIPKGHGVNISLDDILDALAQKHGLTKIKEPETHIENL